MNQGAALDASQSRNLGLAKGEVRLRQLRDCVPLERLVVRYCGLVVGRLEQDRQGEPCRSGATPAEAGRRVSGDGERLAGVEAGKLRYLRVTTSKRRSSWGVRYPCTLGSDTPDSPKLESNLYG